MAGAPITQPITGAMFSSYSEVPYVGEPPRAVRALYLLFLAVGGSVQHGFRFLPKALTPRRQDQIFAAVLAPVVVMLPWCVLSECTHTHLESVRKDSPPHMTCMFRCAAISSKCTTSCPSQRATFS